LDLIPRPAHVKRPKARALGSTLAAIRGVAIDDILVQGNWTSRNVFHDHYRLSSAHSSDITSTV
ncbi:hypothetical protein DM01DRAFT_1275152, partial [Hesseltinella vesiculosa]